MLWRHVAQMYYQDVENCQKLLPRLTFDHINLNAYSKMHVNLAVQVLSASMAAVLRSFGPPEAEGTAKYCEMVDGFFDCLNVRSTTEHQRKRKPFLAPYHDTQDGRYNNDNFYYSCIHVVICIFSSFLCSYKFNLWLWYT